VYVLLAQEREIGTEMSRSSGGSFLCNASRIKVSAHVLGHMDTEQTLFIKL